ncbi:XPA protein C-terminus-domain-containing protein, partial [Gaertneriomyces semiglobifer]
MTMRTATGGSSVLQSAIEAEQNRLSHEGSTSTGPSTHPPHKQQPPTSTASQNGRIASQVPQQPTRNDTSVNHNQDGVLDGEPPGTSGSRKRRAIDLTYCEYNLSTMKDTKGGFILEDQPQAPVERKQKKPEPTLVYDPPPDLANMHAAPKCETCKSIDLDPNYSTYFGLCVCKSCKDKYPEKYSLLTKTECREDYLLTESELRDVHRLPRWERPNPHKSTYSNMLLYVRQQVEAFAWEKWGGPQQLDDEFERREKEKKERKEKKFRAKLSELRKKTRTSTWAKKAEEEH